MTTSSSEFFKSLLALINERGGMTKKEVTEVCRARDPDATDEEIRRARKRLHWNEMVVYDVSGSGPGKYILTEYGLKALTLDDESFQRTLVN